MHAEAEQSEADIAEVLDHPDIPGGEPELIDDAQGLDALVADLRSHFVRAMVDDRGNALKEAGPSTPVEVMDSPDRQNHGLFGIQNGPCLVGTPVGTI